MNYIIKIYKSSLIGIEHMNLSKLESLENIQHSKLKLEKCVKTLKKC